MKNLEPEEIYFERKVQEKCIMTDYVRIRDEKRKKGGKREIEKNLFSILELKWDFFI